MENNILQGLEEQRLKLYNQYQKKTYICYAIIVVCLVLLIVGYIYNDILLGISFIAALITIVVTTTAKKPLNKFINNIKPQLVDYYYEKNGIKNVEYKPYSFIDYHQFIRNLVLFESPDNVLGEDYLKGTYKNVRFEMSDLVLQRIVITTDSKGRTTRRIETYFKGKALTLDYPKDIDSNCFLISKGNSHPALKVEKYETEVIEFNKMFNIYSSKKDTINKILTPHMIDKLMKFKQMQKGPMNLAFTESKLYVLINKSKDLLNISYKQKLEEEYLDNILSDLLLPCAIINEFRFDSYLYQNEVLKPESN